VCPECGTHNTLEPVTQKIPEVRLDAVLVVAVLAASGVAALGGSFAHEAALALDVLRLGYSIPVAVKYASAQDGASEFGLGCLLSIYYITLAPYAATFRSRRRAVQVLTAGIASVLAADVLLMCASMD
jgi:hypothetical protein